MDLFIELDHLNSSLWNDILPYPDTLFWANQSLLFLLNAASREEATDTNLIVFGLTRSRLELTIYLTRWEHANHYATIMVRAVLEADYEIELLVITSGKKEITRTF